ncbi:MAG: phosphopantetheine-protein transferase [Gammaproteobacteria bacterium]|jgi:4'-phosphopantetheinyl transferase|nr:phosphopantetheine-protein transferase [Gammaproteobacteria bacterium]
MQSSSLWISSAPEKIKLHPRDVHVWYAHIAITEAQANAAYPILSDIEKDRAQRFKFGEHRLKFIAARSTLRKILSYYLPIQPASIGFIENQYGKPMLDSTQNKKGIFFNVSHSHDMAVYAISLEENIGVDIEFKEKSLNFDQIALRFFSAQESQYIQSLINMSEKASAFFKIWTGKEAFIKAIGQGLSFPLKEFQISLKGETAFLESIYGDIDRAKTWSLFQLNVPDNYQACGIVESNTVTLAHWGIEFNVNQHQLS